MTKKKFIPILSVLILLALWQLLAFCVDQPEFIPSVPRLVKTLFELLISGPFYLSLGATLIRGLIGMVLSLICALVLALLSGHFQWVYDLFRPLLTIMRSVPVISFILLALIFFHPESIPVIIGFLTMFPLLTENLSRGIRNLKPELFVLSRQFQLGATNRFTQIIYPQLKPFLYSGLASATGFGWRAVIMGEVLSQTTLGIGGEMKRAQIFIDVPELLAWTIVAIVISFLADKVINTLSQIKPPISFQKKETANFPVNGWTGLPIRLTNVSYKYGISNLSLLFDAGQVYGISAPSGTGKTTLLNLINETLLPVTGSINIDKKQGIASVFQEPELLPKLTAAENIALPLARFHTREKALSIAYKILHEIDMTDLEERYPEELSYGQQQRVCIARALTYPSPFLLMDEPFKGLDEKSTEQIITYIRSKQKKSHQTILFTSHNPEALHLLADKIIYLEELK